MMMVSHQTFSNQILAESNLAREIFYALSMEILWNLQMKINVQTISVFIISTAKSLKHYVENLPSRLALVQSFK